MVDFVEAPAGEDEQPYDDAPQCEACAAGTIEGRMFVLSIDEGVACLGCPEENCSGLSIDSEMLQMDDIKVSIRLEKSGGTYEYPNDCNYWYEVKPVEPLMVMQWKDPQPRTKAEAEKALEAIRNEPGLH